MASHTQFVYKYRPDDFQQMISSFWFGKNLFNNIWETFARMHMKPLREELCYLFFVLIEMPIIIFLSNYSFLLGSGCFHNSPTLPLPCVWLCFSCNHTGFWCCFSLICFTGMTDCCSPKCILTAPHHGFPRHQKLPANFLPFVSHFFGVYCPGVQCFRPSFISAVL